MPGWLTRSLADVPTDDRWLGRRERAVLAELRMDWRRADWRLGRWTAKAAVAPFLEVPLAELEILAAPDGAPEAWVGDERMPLSISLSHRGGRALAVVARHPEVVGCDLELIEPRSDAFVREWLNGAERRRLASLVGPARDRAANLIWTAKEAAAKVRREGLRLDVRTADVRMGAGGAAWRPLTVDWCDAPSTAGWWRTDRGFVMTIAGTPAPARPRRIE